MRHRILAHRGFWNVPVERNTRYAIERALVGGYGLETDVRDLDGVLVIAHDPPRTAKPPMTVEALFQLYTEMDAQGWLALNIKADGLSKQLKFLLDAYKIDRAFAFDMSVPDMRGCLASGLLVYTRRSEIEPNPTLYQQSAGVWLDCFDIPHSPSDWGQEVRADGKIAVFVSPELHGRSHFDAWAEWRAELNPARSESVMICTDFPDVAAAFFEEFL